MENKVIPVIAIVLVLLFGVFMVSYTSGDITGYGIFDKFLKFKDKPSEVVVSEPDSEEVVANEDISEAEMEVIPFRERTREGIVDLEILDGDIVCEEGVKLVKDRLYTFQENYRVYLLGGQIDGDNGLFMVNEDGSYILEGSEGEIGNLTIKYRRFYIDNRGWEIAVANICGPRAEVVITSTCGFEKFPVSESSYPISGDEVCATHENRKTCLFGFYEMKVIVGEEVIDSRSLQNFACSNEYEGNTEARQVLCCDFSNI